MSRSARQPLTRAGIVAAGIELADAQGLSVLTMRSLAAHLGFEVMSLYNHVANKDDLLDGMVDAVMNEIEEPASGMPWKQAARVIASSAHGVLLKHHWASPLLPSRWPGPARWRHMETLLRVLDQSGMDAQRVDVGFHAIMLHVQGSAQQQVDYAANEQSMEGAYSRFEMQTREADYPHVYRHMRYHRGLAEESGEFEFVLELILDGLELAPMSRSSSER